MEQKVYGALNRIIEEIKGKRSSECIIKDCIVNHQIMGDDIDLVENWIKKMNIERKLR
jgi:hypothetical protein|tara:strand:- start:1251 stop:1424 length:174 start_codon:yes stop_codon:yes gene_type:complete